MNRAYKNVVHVREADILNNYDPCYFLDRC